MFFEISNRIDELSKVALEKAKPVFVKKYCKDMSLNEIAKAQKQSKRNICKILKKSEKSSWQVHYLYAIFGMIGQVGNRVSVAEALFLCPELGGNDEQTEV